MEFKTIFVTGGAGYLGCQVVKDLATNYPNSKIVIIDNMSRGRLEFIAEVKRKLNTQLIEILPSEKCDIRDTHNMESLFDVYNPEAVVHLASIVDAFSTNRKGKDEECREVNYLATVSLAEVAKRKGAKVFVYQSSVSMYSRGEEIKEDGEKNPLSVYGLMKLKAEEDILKLNDENFTTCSLRSATLVGYTPGFAYQTIINLSCIRAIYDVPINVFESALIGNKTYLTVSDQSKAILFCLKNPQLVKNQAFNVTSFHANMQDVLNSIEKHFGKKPKFNLIKEKTINQQVYTINSDKIKSLGYNPDGKLDEAIASTIKNLKERQKSFNWDF